MCSKMLTGVRWPPESILLHIDQHADVQQNAHGRPLAAAYSVRAFSQAPVSTPLLPRELRPSLRPETLNIKTVFARLKEKGDLWDDFWKRRQRLEDAIESLSRRMPSRTKAP